MPCGYGPWGMTHGSNKTRTGQFRPKLVLAQIFLSMKRKILLITAGLIVILGALALIFAYLLPLQLKDVMLKGISEYLQRPVSVENIRYYPFRGVIIQGFVIYENDHARTPVLRIENLRFNLVLPALFKARTIVIPGVFIQKPFVRLILSETGRWNFSDLLSPQQPRRKKSFPLLIGGLAVQDGQIELIDLSQKDQGHELLTGINLKSRLTLTKGVTFEAETQIPSQRSLVKARGRYMPLTRDLDLHAVISKLDFVKYLRYVPASNNWSLRHCSVTYADVALTMKGPKIETLKGDFRLTADVSFADKNIQGQIFGRKFDFSNISGRLGLKASEFNIKNASFSWGEKFFQLKGNFLIEQLSIKQKGPRIDAGGSVSSDNSLIKIGKEFALLGDIKAQNLVLAKAGDKVEIKCLVDLGQLSIKAGSRFSFQGKVHPMPVNLTWQNGNLAWRSALNIENSQISLYRGTSLSGSFSSDQVHLAMLDKKISVKGLFKTQELSLVFSPNLSFSGSPVLQLNCVYNPSEARPWSYAGFISLKDAGLKGLPQAGDIKAISGRLDFKTDEVKTSGLSLTAKDTALQLTGSVKNFDHPFCDASAYASSMDLGLLHFFMKDVLDKYGLIPSGKAEIRLKYSGSLKPFLSQGMTLKAVFKDASVQGRHFPDVIKGNIAGIYGTLEWKDNNLFWQDLQGTVNAVEYVSSGTLRDLSRPAIQAQLSSTQGQLSLKVDSDGKAYKIHEMTGRTENSTIDLKGMVRADPGSSFYMDLSGNSNLDLSDLRALSPKLRKIINRYKLVGKIRLDAAFRGQTHAWDKGVMTLRASSPQILVSGYRINDVSVRLNQGTTLLGNLNITGNIYDGTLSISSVFDTRKPDVPFQLVTRLKGTRLERLKQDTTMKKTELSGQADFDLDLRGDLKNSKTFQGNAAVIIKDGSLSRLNFLEGLGWLLFIPELEDALFTDAQAHFAIRDERISTGDLFVAGKMADLYGKGWIDFDHQINLEITPKFKMTEIAQSHSLRKYPSAILAQTEGYLVIQYTGSLEQPKRVTKTSFGKVIQKATGGIIEGVQGIFEEIIP